MEKCLHHLTSTSKYGSKVPPKKGWRRTRGENWCSLHHLPAAAPPHVDGLLHRNCRNLAEAQFSVEPHFLADPTILLCPLVAKWTPSSFPYPLHHTTFRYLLGGRVKTYFLTTREKNMCWLSRSTLGGWGCPFPESTIIPPCQQLSMLVVSCLSEWGKKQKPKKSSLTFSQLLSLFFDIVQTICSCNGPSSSLSFLPTTSYQHYIMGSLNLLSLSFHFTKNLSKCVSNLIFLTPFGVYWGFWDFWLKLCKAKLDLELRNFLIPTNSFIFSCI